MAAAEPDTLPIASFRQFYAEELRVTANLRSALLVEALAKVKREDFLGPPPWSFTSQAPSKDGSYRTTEDVRDLYHDVVVALKLERQLNNGQPSLIAGCIDQLHLAAGKRMLHIGCGTGYYTAIMATMVGSAGKVRAFEVDADLAALARSNLAAYGNVEVHHRDGAEFRPVPCPAEGQDEPPGAECSDGGTDCGSLDAIFVNATVCYAQPAWLNALVEGGTLVLPLAAGETARSRRALVLKIVRRGRGFSAELCSLFDLYLSPTMQNEAVQSRLRSSLESKAIGRLKSLRIDDHTEDAACLVHATGFCLSARAVGAEGQG
jgi:protein-L-isoaspartate(D-aspartate) O-methyltransferase